ncbi:SRPBCC domain-containing protein [Fictibacillus nanhaiensis]|uniref:SRPBCC family protein n=1 Tax=Fictibacillus nanhaiensis TaxID=742169 RepID=UPI001C98B2C8|nr:SRPBCC domain-containing protein [Fictibacillus nanhaiensis]MBY6038052.1 SRPBCC domain-containing protein [Fictibacillus nanhaiensis]
MPKLTHRTFIKVAPEQVYQILTTAEGWNTWFTDHTSLYIEPNGTGEIRLRWTEFGKNQENMEDGGKIIEAIPHKTFIFQWSPGESTTTVSFTLEPFKEGTLVVLNETGYTDSDNDLAACIGCAGAGEKL